MAYSPQGRKESDKTERLHFHFQAQIMTVEVIKELSWKKLVFDMKQKAIFIENYD